MNFIRIFVLIFLFTLLATGKGSAQENDLGTWIDVTAMHKIRSMSFGLMGEFYTKDRNQSVERASIGLKGDYALTPSLNCGFGYLLMNYYKTGYNELRNRFYLQSELGWHLSKFAFSMRERMQVTFYPETMASSKDTYSYWRNRIKVEYNNGSWKLVPVVDVESFLLVGKGSRNRFDEFRYSAGVNYKLTRNQKVKLYGLLADTQKVNLFVLGVGYDLKF